MLLSQKMCLLLLKTYQVVAIFECLQQIFYTARELVFTVLDTSVNCLCGNTKKLDPFVSNKHIKRKDRHNNFPEIA